MKHYKKNYGTYGARWDSRKGYAYYYKTKKPSYHKKTGYSYKRTKK